jgi:hypothetical protein
MLVPVHFGVHQLLLQVDMQCLLLAQWCNATGLEMGAVVSKAFRCVEWVGHDDLLLMAATAKLRPIPCPSAHLGGSRLRIA